MNGNQNKKEKWKMTKVTEQTTTELSFEDTMSDHTYLRYPDDEPTFTIGNNTGEIYIPVKDIPTLKKLLTQISKIPYTGV